ncbi:MAG: hypothetical protein Q8R33_14395, partial [Burkholderiales bacterium]|nr:hypothetical protein [Burkholderiales bacterium]
TAASALCVLLGHGVHQEPGAHHPGHARSRDPARLDCASPEGLEAALTLILQSGVLDKHPVAHIVATAKPFKVDIQTTPEGKIVLPVGASDLRRLLRFLDEDYYESPLTQTQYVSNSKRVAD